MRSVFLKIIFILSISYLYAIPAINSPIKLTQANGIEFEAFVRGDEWNNWHETIDGYSIAKNNQNIWKYALDIEGTQFKLSNREAHLLPVGISVEKHLQPIPNFLPPNHAEENPIELSNMSHNILRGLIH